MVECELEKADFQQRLGPRGVLIISWGLMIGIPSARYRVGLHMQFKGYEEQHFAEEQCFDLLQEHLAEEPALCI